MSSVPEQKEIVRASSARICEFTLEDGIICGRKCSKEPRRCKVHKNFAVCGICSEESGDVTPCSECAYKACAKCLLTYLNNKVGAPTCPNCLVQWTFAQVKRKLAKWFPAFYDAYSSKLLRKEEPVLRLLQPKVVVLRELDKIYLQRRALYDQITQVDANIRALQEKLKDKNVDVRATARCPFARCSGFIMNESECSLCKAQLCADCGEVIESEHKCDPSVLESLRLIRGDSKPCPNCHSPVFAIPGGCSQMFCTICLTAFDWNTCAVELGIVHNPHYKEYIEREYNFTPRIEGEGHASLFWELSEAPPLNSPHVATLARYFYREELRARQTFLVRLDTKKMQQQRLAYLAQKMSEKDFRDKLFDEHSSMVRTVAALRIVEWAREELTKVVHSLFRRDNEGFFVGDDVHALANYVERHLGIIDAANSKFESAGITKAAFRFSDSTTMFPETFIPF